MPAITWDVYKRQDLINTQVNKEFYSAYLYLDFANFYVEQGLNGFANWYQVQAQEERDHAMLFVKYLQNNDAKVTYEAIDKPNIELKNNMDPLQAGLKHEQYVTSLINNKMCIRDSSWAIKRPSAMWQRVFYIIH